MAPGPWSATQHGTADRLVQVHDPDGNHIADVPTWDGPYEHAYPISGLPDLAAAYVSSQAEMVAVNHQLRAAGIEYPLGSRGVSDLTDQRDGARARAAEADEEFEQQGRAWTATLEELNTAQARLAELRTVLGRWAGRDMPEVAYALYREITGALMTSAPPPDTTDDNQEGSTDGE
jgi:hypothetical protein